MNECVPIVDWLTYCAYEKKRKSNPHVAYYRWRRIFKDAPVFEEIYDRYLKNIQPLSV